MNIEKILLLISFIILVPLAGTTIALYDKIADLESNQDKIFDFVKNIPESIQRFHVDVDRENDCWVVTWRSHVDLEYADVVNLGDNCK